MAAAACNWAELPCLLAANSQLVVGEYSESPGHLRSVCAHGCGHELGLLVPAKPLQTHKQYACMEATLPKDQFAEVLVAGHQQGTKAIRLRQYALIRQTRRELGDIGDIVTVFAERFYDAPVDALITVKVQAASPGAG